MYVQMNVCWLTISSIIMHSPKIQALTYAKILHNSAPNRSLAQGIVEIIHEIVFKKQVYC